MHGGNAFASCVPLHAKIGFSMADGVCGANGEISTLLRTLLRVSVNFFMFSASVSYISINHVEMAIRRSNPMQQKNSFSSKLKTMQHRRRKKKTHNYLEPSIF
jgi:hypothetical protein